MLIDLGLLILRVVLGLTFIGHGGQKLFGYFGGPGMAGWSGAITMMGFRPVRFWALVSALGEFAGGLLVILGFLTPLGELAIIAVMLVAIVKVHWPKGFWNTKGGIEFPLLNIAAALALALTGPGSYSLDTVLHISLPQPLSLLVGLVLVVLGLIAALASRSLQPEPAPQSTNRSS